MENLHLNVTGKEKLDFTLYLDNAYETYKLDPEQKDAVIRQFVSAAIETFAVSGEGVDKSRIVPVVKDRDWLEETKQALVPGGAKEVSWLVYEDLNAELVILYAEDSPKNIGYLTSDDLEKTDIKKKDLRALACKNLRNILPKIEMQGADGIYMLTAGGVYEASLLLLDSIWSGKQIEVKGDIVVAIPTRDILLVTGSDDKDGINKVKGIVKETLEDGGPYRLTSKLFVYRDGKFVEFKE